MERFEIDCLSTYLVVGLPCPFSSGHFSMYMKITI